MTPVQEDVATETQRTSSAQWSSFHSYFLLGTLTLLCLLPFCGRAFHIDDPLFVWAGQQIVKHPSDPYGFQVLWDNYVEPMSEVTKNPPLGCYYIAVIGRIAGWSERALHLGFLLPALALVLGTYRLARRFTRSPLIASAATLLTPGILVSASSVMCDTMMLAFWIWAATLWIEGLEDGKAGYLAASGLLMGAAELTKYYGVCLIPLLLLYSIARKQRAGWWMLYFALPLAMLGGYQFWTAMKYGHGMFSDALKFAPAQRVINGRVSTLTNALIGVSFMGGCALPVLMLSPFLWRWKKIAMGLLLGAFAGLALALGWISLGPHTGAVRDALRMHWQASALQLTLDVATGIGVLWLAASELWNWKDSDSLFLGLWVLGTYVFTGFLNWTINVRSVLPLIPAAGILLARRLDKFPGGFTPQLQKKIALALILSGIVSFWLAQADAEWANSAKLAAVVLHQRTENEKGTLWFQGHWGFQYYIQQFGARPVDYHTSVLNPGDLLVVPENNVDAFRLPSPQFVASGQLIEIKLQQPLSTMRWRVGAGFYASFYGPLPFAFGTPATEKYYLFRLGTQMAPRLVPRHEDPGNH